MVPSTPVFLNTEKRKAQPYLVSLHLFHRQYLEELRQTICIVYTSTVNTLPLKMRFVKKCFWQLFASVGSGNSNCGKSTLCTVLTLLPWKCDWLKRQRPALLLGHNLNNFFSASSEQNTFFHNCLVSAGVIHRSFDHQTFNFSCKFCHIAILLLRWIFSSSF